MTIFLDHLCPKEWLPCWLSTWFHRWWRKEWEMRICAGIRLRTICCQSSCQSQRKALRLWTVGCPAWWCGHHKRRKCCSRRRRTGATVLAPSCMSHPAWRGPGEMKQRRKGGVTRRIYLEGWYRWCSWGGITVRVAAVSSQGRWEGLWRCWWCLPWTAAAMAEGAGVEESTAWNVAL